MGAGEYGLAVAVSWRDARSHALQPSPGDSEGHEDQEPELLGEDQPESEQAELACHLHTQNGRNQPGNAVLGDLVAGLEIGVATTCGKDEVRLRGLQQIRRTRADLWAGPDQLLETIACQEQGDAVDQRAALFAIVPGQGTQCSLALLLRCRRLGISGGHQREQGKAGKNQCPHQWFYNQCMQEESRLIWRLPFRGIPSIVRLDD